MEPTENFAQGDIVYMTHHAQDWLGKGKEGFSIPMAGRIAKVVKVFDWDSDEGRILLEKRVKSGKWKDLDPKSFRYMVAIYYPELKMEGHEMGIKAPESMPYRHPSRKGSPPLFEKWNPSLLKDLFNGNETVSIMENEQQAPAPKAAPAPKSKRGFRVVSKSAGS